MAKVSNAAVAVGARDGSEEQAGAAISANLLSRIHSLLSLFILFLTFFLGQYDKFILSYFKISVTEELEISSVKYGLLSGYATGISYAVLSLPLAYVSDRSYSRVWTLTVAVIWWSLCVIFQALSHAYWHLVCARIGMGIGQSAAESLSVSLISDLIGPRQYVSVGESTLYIGIYIGEAISGQISTAFKVTGTSWRWALKGVGIFGIGAGVVLRVIMWHEIPRREALISDDRRQEQHTNSKRQLRLAIRHIANMRSFGLFALSAGLRTLSGSVFGYYMPSYVQTLYPKTDNIMSVYGIIVGVVGSAACLTGGLLSSWFWRWTRFAPLYLVSIGGFLSSIFVCLMVFSRDLASGSESNGSSILYGTMVGAYLTAELWLGPINGLLILMMNPDVKTFIFAIYSSVVTLIASSGPEIVGLAMRHTDSKSRAHTDTMRLVLAVVIPGGYIVSSVGFLTCIPLIRKDLIPRDPLSSCSETKKRVSRHALLGGGVTILLLVITLFCLSLVYQE